MQREKQIEKKKARESAYIAPKEPDELKAKRKKKQKHDDEASGVNNGAETSKKSKMMHAVENR